MGWKRGKNKSKKSWKIRRSFWMMDDSCPNLLRERCWKLDKHLKIEQLSILVEKKDASSPNFQLTFHIFPPIFPHIGHPPTLYKRYLTLLHTEVYSPCFPLKEYTRRKLLRNQKTSKSEILSRKFQKKRENKRKTE